MEAQLWSPAVLRLVPTTSLCQLLPQGRPCLQHGQQRRHRKQGRPECQVPILPQVSQSFLKALFTVAPSSCRKVKGGFGHIGITVMRLV